MPKWIAYPTMHYDPFRNVVKQIDGLLARVTLPSTMTSISGAMDEVIATQHHAIGRELVQILTPWLICGTKDCGHVIAHLAQQLFQYALVGLPNAKSSAKLIKIIHEEQVTLLRFLILGNGLRFRTR